MTSFALSFAAREFREICRTFRISGFSQNYMDGIMGEKTIT